MYPTGKIIEQATIAGFADYLLNAEFNDIENDSNYEERIKTAYDHCKKVILSYDRNEDSELMLAMYQLIDEYEKVYMELGLRSGIKFLTDITGFSPNESLCDEQDNDIYPKMSDRVSLQALSAFIKNGAHCVKLDKRSFEEREKKSYAGIVDELNKHLDDDNLEAIENKINSYVATLESVQFSLGMKAGARLMQQLICDPVSDY